MNENFMKDAIVRKTVYESTNYGKFRLHEFNRDIKRTKVEALKNSFLTYGQQMPILVNVEGKIYDGNHSFIACKELEVPFMFILTEETDDDLIRDLNNTQHNWSIQDFIDSNAKKGNRNYILANKLGEEYSIRPAVIARALGKKGTGTKDIKEGKLIMHTKEYLTKFLSYHKDFSFLPRQKDSYFIQALFDVYNEENVDEIRLYQQIVKNMEIFEFSIPYKICVGRMKEIYNHNLKKEENRI